MANMTVILFLCAAVPMIPALNLMRDTKSKLFLGYMMLGMLVCLIASEVNAQLLRLFGGDMLYVSTNITPIAEELLKALPVLYFALVFSDDRNTLISISFAMGLGFALLENMVILTGNVETVTIPWALIRGFGAAWMHSACTAMVGRGISYVHKRRKLFYCGTFSLLVTAVIGHAIFNTLIQARYREVALIAVLLMYAPQWIRIARRYASKARPDKAG